MRGMQRGWDGWRSCSAVQCPPWPHQLVQLLEVPPVLPRCEDTRPGQHWGGREKRSPGNPPARASSSSVLSVQPKAKVHAAGGLPRILSNILSHNNRSLRPPRRQP